MYIIKLRLVWFPDINHVEHNVDKGIMTACDLENLSEKALFLGRLHRGPKKAAGKWHGQIKQAYQADGQRCVGCLGFRAWISGLRFRLGFQACAAGLDFRFGFQAWASGLDFRLALRDWI